MKNSVLVINRPYFTRGVRASTGDFLKLLDISRGLYKLAGTREESKSDQSRCQGSVVKLRNQKRGDSVKTVLAFT